MKKLLVLAALLMLTNTLSAKWSVYASGPGVIFTLNAGTIHGWPLVSSDNDSAPEILWWETIHNQGVEVIEDISLYTTGTESNPIYSLKVTVKANVGYLQGGYLIIYYRSDHAPYGSMEIPYTTDRPWPIGPGDY